MLFYLFYLDSLYANAVEIPQFILHCRVVLLIENKHHVYLILGSSYYNYFLATNAAHGIVL